MIEDAKKKKKSKKWISKAIKRPGALSKKAKRAGKSVAQYCQSPAAKKDPTTRRQCNLYKTLQKMNKKKKKRR